METKGAFRKRVAQAAAGIVGPEEREAFKAYAATLEPGSTIFWKCRAGGPAGMDWQPIETAPKDGFPLLLTDGRLFGGGHWTNAGSGPWFWYVNGCSAFDPEGDTWDYDGALIFEPTHWMPLPKPPAQGTLLREDAEGG